MTSWVDGGAELRQVGLGTRDVVPGDSPSGPVVEVRGVGKIYRPTPRAMRLLVRTTIYSDVVALDGVDLRVDAGETVAIVGPNGAGKTTLFRILTGLTTPTTGHAHVLGLDVDRQSLEVRRVVGFMPAEDRSLFMRMTCLENLIFHARLQHVPKREITTRCLATLEEVGLAEQARSAVFAISAGMRARLQLARAILHRPRLVVLDEPTGAVDPVGAHELLALLQDLVKEHGLAALISSHRLEEIEALGSNVVLLDRGRIRYHGDLDSLRVEWQRSSVELVFERSQRAAQAAAVLDRAGVDVRRDGPSLECRLPAGSTVGAMLRTLEGLVDELIHVSEPPVPLRDILAELYSRPMVAAEDAR